VGLQDRHRIRPGSFLFCPPLVLDNRPTISDDLEIALGEKPMKNRRPLTNEALRLLRLYIGLSQKDLANTLGVSQSMISEVESGTKSVSMELLERYSDNFNVRMSQLLFFAEELEGEPIKTRGKLIIASHVLSLLEKLSPKEVINAS
jgi:transcriptional regulator with XRE-family HTH domain